MVTRCRQLTPTANIYQASAENLPLPDESQDLVTTTMSFHHWMNQCKGMSEASRVLRAGGFFVLADTNIGHGHPLSRSKVRQVFESSRLSVLSQVSVVPFLTITVGEKV
jgi:ubiquinone/menaquinone biosynthesis C-methylase UbiE